MHFQGSHYLPCSRCGELVTEMTPDFLEALATGVWPETGRGRRVYSVFSEQDDVGNVTVSYVLHNPARCARARRRRDVLVA